MFQWEFKLFSLIMQTFSLEAISIDDAMYEVDTDYFRKPGH